MTVIAMTREMGSRGRDVALRLSEELGLSLVQHQLVEHVADKMHLQEGAVNRFLEGKSGLLERWGIDERQLSLYTTEEILDLAAGGNVLIRGWGAAYVLREIPHVLSIRVCASESTRAQVLMERIGLEDRTAALKEIRANDAAHTRTMVHMFHMQDWGNPGLYDAVFNTDHVSVDTCVTCVKEIIASPEFRQTPQSAAMLADMSLEAHINTALKLNAATSNAAPTFEVSIVPGTGRVVLSGLVYDEAFARDALDTVSGVPGVEAVEDRLSILSQAPLGP